ncbi:P2 [Halyomorpha halys reo-like associated virus 1]|nr:P2 [Halyomorpha halys reo-like associated virus 1]
MNALLKYLHSLEDITPPSFQLKRLSSGTLNVNVPLTFTATSFIDCNLYYTFTSSKGIVPKNLCVALRSVIMIYYSYISLVSDEWFTLESEMVSEHSTSYSTDSRWAGALLNLTDTVFSLMRDTPRVSTYKVGFGKSKSIPLTTNHVVEVTGGDDNLEFSIPENRYKLSVSYEYQTHSQMVLKSRLRNLHSIPSSGVPEIFEVEFQNTKDDNILHGILEMTLKCLNTISGNDPLKSWTVNGILDPAVNVFLTRSGGEQENDHYKYVVSLDWFKTNNVIFLEHVIAPADKIVMSMKISPPNALPLTSLIQRNVNVNIVYGNMTKGVTIEWKPLVVTSDGLTRLEFIGSIDIIDLLGIKKVVRHLNNVPGKSSETIEVSLTQDNNSTKRLHSETDFIFKYEGHKQLSKMIVDVDAFYNYQGTGNIPIPEIAFNIMGSDIVPPSNELQLIPNDYRNGDILLMTKNQLIFNGHVLSLELSNDPLATVSYITDPFGKGYMNTLDMDVQRLSLQMIELGNRNEEIMAMVDDMNKRIELISNTLEQLLSPANMIFQSLSNLAMFISPIAAVCLQGINTILEISQLVKGDADLGNIMNIITSAILFFIALKTHLNISMPRTDKLDICKRVWDGFKLRSTSGEPTLIRYSRLEDETQLVDPSLYRHMTISRKMKKMDPETNGKIFGLAADIRERIENGTANLSERVLFRALEKMKIGPWHEYLQITDVEEIGGKIHTKVFVTGVADGSAVEVEGAMIGSGNVPLSKRSDGASPGCITFYTVRDKESGIAEVVPWRLSGNSWEEIMTSLNYEIPNEKPPEEEIQATYELLAKSFCYELGFDESTKGIYTQREWIHPMMPHQIRALSELINENKINRKYMLVGNNCQNYVRSIENLIFSQERPGAWVSEESYKKYLRSIFDNL